MLAACTTSQQPYAVASYYTFPVQTYETGNSVAEACIKFHVSRGFNLQTVTDHACSSTGFGGNPWPVIKVCEPKQELSLMPFDISVEAAGQIAVAIAAVWATAWVLRTLGQLITSGGNSTKDET